MQPQISRRRAISISAAAAGFALVPAPAASSATADIVTWRGTALGAVATMQIHHPDRATAERLVTRSIFEVRRLESVFSLYRPDSALVALNRHGALAMPPPELVELIAESRRYSEMTGGAFDVTVQPLWNLYVEHFSRTGADPAGPGKSRMANALARVDYQGILANRDRIAFARPGMQVTLNGIAQGYITDRIVDLLRAEGITQTLVDMGETRGVGTYPDGRPWRVGIADPDQLDRVGETIPIVDRAVATSGGYGFRFDAQGRVNHLFDPKTGQSSDRFKSVTVVMTTATSADALSTAFSIMSTEGIEAVLTRLGGGQVRLVCADGRKMILGMNGEATMAFD